MRVPSFSTSETMCCLAVLHAHRQPLLVAVVPGKIGCMTAASAIQ